MVVDCLLDGSSENSERNEVLYGGAFAQRCFVREKMSFDDDTTDVCPNFSDLSDCGQFEAFRRSSQTHNQFLDVLASTVPVGKEESNYCS